MVFATAVVARAACAILHPFIFFFVPFSPVKGIASLPAQYCKISSKQVLFVRVMLLLLLLPNCGVLRPCGLLFAVLRLASRVQCHRHPRFHPLVFCSRSAPFEHGGELVLSAARGSICTRVTFCRSVIRPGGTTQSQLCAHVKKPSLGSVTLVRDSSVLQKFQRRVEMCPLSAWKLTFSSTALYHHSGRSLWAL